jgi:enterochelin esterase family protein
MRKRSIAFFLFLIPGLAGFCQQALRGAPEIISPEIHESGKVTIRVLAPDAKEVKVSGDWLPPDGFMPGSAGMTKDDKGVWSYTSEVLTPELYIYNIIVDGFRTTDPANPFCDEHFHRRRWAGRHVPGARCTPWFRDPPLV